MLAPLARHGGRVEDLFELLFREDALLADKLDDPLAGLHGLRGELGGAMVADDRVQGRDRADAVLYVVPADLGVGRDSLDAVDAQRAGRVDEYRLRFEDAGGDDRLERI